MNKPLRFNIELGRTKPVNIRNEQVRCPFCDRSKLTDILDTSGHIIWLMNKYPVLEKTWPTVIIETETDEGEFSTLPADEAAHILQADRIKYGAPEPPIFSNLVSINGAKLVSVKSSNPYSSSRIMAICPVALFVILTAKS